MDEVLRRKGVWIGLAVIGAIFLCVIACVLGPLLMLAPRQVVTYAPYAQPPAAEDGGQVYQAPAITRHSSVGPMGVVGWGFRLLLKLLFFGLLLMLGLRLMRHMLWGPRHPWAPYWGPYYHGVPPRGPQEGDETEAGWGPPPWVRRTWRHHHRHWGPPPWWGPGQEQAGDKPAADAPGDEYTGPQE